MSHSLRNIFLLSLLLFISSVLCWLLPQIPFSWGVILLFAISTGTALIINHLSQVDLAKQISTSLTALNRALEQFWSSHHQSAPSIDTHNNNTAEGTIDYLRDNVVSLIRQHDLLTTNIAASVVIFDIDRQPTFCSAFTEFLTGYSVDEILAPNRDTLLEIVIDDDRDRYLRAWNVSRLGEDIHVRYQIIHRSGLRLWLETRFVPVSNEQGEISAIMSVTMDLTDTLAYQKQIEEKNRDLQDFSYMVSHDLKAPIFTIKGMASALEEDYGTTLGADGNELLQYIVDAAGRLERLVASVLQYSRISTQQTKDSEIELRGVIENVLRDFAQQIKDASAQIVIDFDSLKVRGDALRYYQVFSNLIGNAIKYRANERALLISIRLKQDNIGRVTIECLDNGSGIPADKIGDIFRPFHRAHGSEIEGSGIGLACVKKIVENYGGTVTVKSDEGEGSVFSITLPAPAPQPQSIPEDLAHCFE